MRKISMKMAALGLVAALSLTVAACAPEEPQNGTGTGRPGAAQETPSTSAQPTPANGVLGAQATPGVAGTLATTPVATPVGETTGMPTPAPSTPATSPMATPGMATTPMATPRTGTGPGAMGMQTQDERTGAEVLLDDIESFNDRVGGLTGDPLPSDLPGMVQQAALLLHGLHMQYDTMDVADREDALETMSEAVGRMAEAFEAYHDEMGGRTASVTGTTGVTVTPGVTGTPTPVAPGTVSTPGAVATPRTMATPGVVATPGMGAAPGASTAMQFDREIERLQSDVAAMDGEQVTGLEISELLLTIETVLDGMSQQAEQVQADDLEPLYQVMSDLREVVVDYAAQAYEMTGVGTTGTGMMTLPTPGTGGMTATPTPSVGVATPGTGGMASPTPRP